MGVERDLTDLILQWIIIIFAFFSLFCSVAILILTFIRRNKITFIRELMLYVTCSEIINSISKLLFLHRLNKYLDNNEPICYTQVFFNVYSDFLTLLSTVILSIVIYDKVILSSKWSRMKYWNALCRGVPLAVSFITSMGYGWDYYAHNQYKIDGLKIPLWCWVGFAQTISIYSIIFICILIIIIFSSMLIIFLKKKKLEVSEELSTELNEETFENENKSIMLIDETITKLYLYPFISVFIWSFLFLDRMITQYTNSSVAYIFIFIHAILCSSRGVIYGFTYLGNGMLKKHFDN